MIIKILDAIKLLEIKIADLWKCDFTIPLINQKMSFGSWKIVISLPAHLIIGFTTAIITNLIVGDIDKSFLVAGLSTGILLEFKDYYKYIWEKNLTMFLQGIWDAGIYFAGASLILLLK